MSASASPRRPVDPNAVSSPYPRRAEPLPRNRSDVTANWLTRTLQNEYPGVVVERMELIQLLDSHTTKMRVAITLNEAGRAAGLPERLCLKSNWSGLFQNVDICALEARFYHFLATRLRVPTARCYYADWDTDDSGQGLIVLEDLNDRGGHFGHSTQHAGVEAVARALTGLAAMHTSLWDSPLLAQQRWLQTSMHTPVDYDQVRIMWHWIEENLKDPNFRAIAPRHYLEDPRRVERGLDRLVEFERNFQSPYCLILGDCHQGNTYILPDGERLWLDWQLVRRGRPWRDLTYFMVGSLTIEERRGHERDLIAHFRNQLLTQGATDVISLDAIWEQYRRWVMYGIQAWAANMDSWGQNGLPMNQRFFTAGEDLGTWKLLLGD